MRETDNAYSQTDSDTLSEALHTDAHLTTDLAFGRGEHYKLAGGQSTLEIFPEHRMSRITTPTSRLELFDSPPPRIVDGQVVISREDGLEELTLTVSPEGTVVFGYVVCPAAPATSDMAPDEPQTAPETAQEPSAAAPASDYGRAAADSPPEAPLSPVPSGAGLRPPATQQHHPEPVAPQSLTTEAPDVPSQSNATGTFDVPSDPAPASDGRTGQPTKEQQPRVH